MLPLTAAAAAAAAFDNRVGDFEKLRMIEPRHFARDAAAGKCHGSGCILGSGGVHLGSSRIQVGACIRGVYIHTIPPKRKQARRTMG